VGGLQLVACNAWLATKGSLVPVLNRLSLALALAGALTLTGCGKREPTDAARTAKNQNQSQAGKDVSLSPARIEAKSKVQSQPNSGEARFQLGKLLLNDGEATPALVELQRALEFKHPEAQVLPLIAEALVLTGQARKVIDTYADKKLDDAEANARLQAAVAHALAATNEMDRARTVVNAALAKAPKSAPALLVKARLQAAANDNTGGLATLEELLAAHPGHHEAWALKGELLLRSPTGAKQAIEAFNKALEARPDQIFSHSALVSLYLAQGDVEAARKAFAKLQKLAPKHPNTALFDAHLAYAAGDHARARDIYLALLRALPENVNVLLSAGENELRLNATQQAESYFAKAASLAPRNPLARRLLAQAQIKLGQSAKALLTLGPLVDDPGASAEVLAIAAQARLMAGDAKTADILFTRLAQLKPVDPRLRTVVATANFGKSSDDAVFSQLGAIAAEDAGTTADMALITAHMRRQQAEPALQSGAQAPGQCLCSPAAWANSGDEGRQAWCPQELRVRPRRGCGLLPGGGRTGGTGSARAKARCRPQAPGRCGQGATQERPGLAGAG
jgi:putative PEP-CTERM system TPR-repeat lipoprotein